MIQAFYKITIFLWMRKTAELKKWQLSEVTLSLRAGWSIYCFFPLQLKKGHLWSQVPVARLRNNQTQVKFSEWCIFVVARSIHKTTKFSMHQIKIVPLELVRKRRVHGVPFPHPIRLHVSGSHPPTSVFLDECEGLFFKLLAVPFPQLVLAWGIWATPAGVSRSRGEVHTILQSAHSQIQNRVGQLFPHKFLKAFLRGSLSANKNKPYTYRKYTLDKVSSILFCI